MSESNLFNNGDEKPPKRKAKAPSERIQPPAVRSPRTLLQTIAEVAADPAVNTEKMKALAEIQRDVEGRARFNQDYLVMKPKLPTITKDNKITLKTGGSYSVASFENIHKTIEPTLLEHGFNIWHQPDVHPITGQYLVRSYLEHKDGFFRPCAMPVPTKPGIGMNDQQGIGAATTYAKRYNTISLLNLISEAPQDRDTDAGAETKTINGAQAKRLLVFINENDVPVEIAFKKFGIANLQELPASQYGEFEAACINYGKRNKVAK